MNTPARQPDSSPAVSHDLAVALCSGPWAVHPIAIRWARFDGGIAAQPGHVRAAAALVVAYPDGIGAETLVRTGWPTAFPLPAPGALITSRDRPAPRPLAHLTDAAALATLLDVPLDDLDHLARWHRPDADTGPRRAQHYRYVVRAARGGGVRIIEAPKERLKEVQRRLLKRVLAPLPLHPAAFGSAPRRGVLAAIDGIAGSPVVLALDMERWFTSITTSRVSGWLRRAGAGPDPALLIARLVTNAVPRGLRRGLPALPGRDGPDRTRARERQLAHRHLPQGAPTSPRLADLIAGRLDVRMTALADRAGVVYHRYSDDMFLAGPAAADPRALLELAADVVRSEGFVVAEQKSRVQRSSGQQTVLGAVVNVHPTLSRSDRDRLRAIVHNCVTHGWRSQVRDGDVAGFRARLVGQVGWLAALDPPRGRRLLAELDVVDWS